VFLATVVGLVAGAIIGLAGRYYTAEGKGPSNGVADASLKPARPRTSSPAGRRHDLDRGAVLVLAVATIACYYFAGLYGIALGGLACWPPPASSSAVTPTGPSPTTPAASPIMAHLEKEVRQRTDKLDAVGNTTAAIGKGFAIGFAALTALALFAAFRETVNLPIIDVTDPKVMAGLLVGSMMPFLCLGPSR
jgi:K(+)-stimulated pyrophosphate-energized sodium pump